MIWNLIRNKKMHRMLLPVFILSIKWHKCRGMLDGLVTSGEYKSGKKMSCQNNCPAIGNTLGMNLSSWAHLTSRSQISSSVKWRLAGLLGLNANDNNSVYRIHCILYILKWMHKSPICGGVISQFFGGSEKPIEGGKKPIGESPKKIVPFVTLSKC